MSEAPPCGFAAYMWLYEIVRVVAGGVNPSSNQNHSTSTDLRIEFQIILNCVCVCVPFIVNQTPNPEYGWFP